MAPKIQRKAFINSFRHVQLGFSQLYARLLAEAGISLPQYALINLLYFVGPMSMSDTSARLGISKPAVTYLVDRLEEGNYLTRQPHPKDRRVFLLTNKTKGERVIRRIQQTVLALLMTTLKGFSSSEATAVLRFYDSLPAGMDGANRKDELKRRRRQ